MSHFTRRVTLPVSADELFAWHERPGAFERLTPPWQRVTVVEQSGGIRDGGRVVLELSIGPVPVRWTLAHRDYARGRQFRDVQLHGPFAVWDHRHRMEPVSAHQSILDDSIGYRLPFGVLGRIGGHRFARSELRRLFAYRHAVTAADLSRHAAFADKGTLTVAITGATGLVGSSLIPYLTTAGHTVRRLVRHGGHAKPGDARPGDIGWAPERGELDPAALDGVDAVIHLAGSPISERWSDEHKREVVESRVQGTRTIARAIAAMPRKPKVLLSASAVGFYGDTGDREADETTPAGTGFLADVARAWEAETGPAEQAGVRVVHPRFGIIVTPKGGALAKLLPPFQLGAGGKLGNGQQWMSWVALDDVLGALEHLLFTESASGAYNVTSPRPVTNEQFSHTLAHVLGRPALMTVPAFALRAMFGEMADEMLLAGQRVLPRRLEASDFRFRLPDLEAALRFELGR